MAGGVLSAVIRSLAVADDSALAERVELVDYAIRLLTGGGCDERAAPRFLTGADAARAIAARCAMSERNARRVVARARELISAELAADLPSRAATLASLQLDVLREARRDRDWPSCNGAIRNLITIYGLGGPVRLQRSTSEASEALVAAIRMTPGERDAEIRRLEACDHERARGSFRPPR